MSACFPWLPDLAYPFFFSLKLLMIVQAHAMMILNSVFIYELQDIQNEMRQDVMQFALLRVGRQEQSIISNIYNLNGK